MSSHRDRPVRNVPPPPGARPASAYARFIPREELGDEGVRAWQPGNLGAAPQGRAAEPAAPPEPSAEDWRAQVAQARAGGYADGYRDGMAALENFKHSFAAQAYTQVGQLLDSVDAQLQALEARMAQALAAAAVALARQLIRAELQAQPEVVARVAAEAVNQVLLSARQITVHLNPEDCGMVAEHAAETLAARGARLVEDIAIARGGCLVVSDAGCVDARIEARWALAAATLGSPDAPAP